MIITKWLTINSNKSVRITHNQPSLAANEISVKLQIKIPDALFKKPRLEAKIEIPEEAVGPDMIDSHVVENVQEAIKSVTGLEFHIDVIKEEKEEC